MMRAMVSAFALCLLVPTLALAVSSAGFAPGTLWLSKTDASEGDPITIFTVVYNSSPSPIEGAVIFILDEKEIGGQEFALDAGESKIVSTSWTATAGTHAFSARLSNIKGVDEAPAIATTDVVNIAIAEASPTAMQQYTSTVENVLQVAGPTVQNFATAVYTKTEDIRKKGADWLSDQLVREAVQTPQSPSVALASDTETPTSDSLSIDKAPPSLVSKAKQYALAGLLPIFEIKYLFYIAVLAVLYALYKLIQGFFRYRRGY